MCTSRIFCYQGTQTAEMFHIFQLFMHMGLKLGHLQIREERRLTVSENRVLMRIFGPKRDEVTKEWRKLHNEEFNDLYCSPHIVRVIKSRILRWAGHVACMGERGGVYRLLMGKPEGKRPFGRPRRRWENDFEMDLQEVGCWGTDWIKLAQDRDKWYAILNAVMNLWVS